MERAYQEGSTEGLRRWLKGWMQDSAEEDAAWLAGQPAPVREAHAVFEAFYRSRVFSEDRVGDGQPPLAGEVEFFLVQDRIEVLVRDLHAPWPDPDPTTGVPPEPPGIVARYVEVALRAAPVRPETVLRLNAELRRELVAFLEREGTESRVPSLMSTAQPVGPSAKRLAFLNRLLRIQLGHWTGWLLNTDPQVSCISLHPDHQEALVSFRLLYRGGHAHMKKIEGEWRMVDYAFTWIH